MTASVWLLAQVLLTFHPTTAAPLRFGVPLPARHLERGLRLESPGPARLQWRRLQHGRDPQTGRVWVELCITGARGRCRLLAGGLQEADGDVGPVVRRVVEKEATEELTWWRERWHWQSGERDQLSRCIFHARTVHEQEAFEDGEALTSWSAGYLERFLGSGIPARWWRKAGVLPGTGRRAKPYRRHLQRLARSLEEAPGRRGRGDYRRSGGVMTNLEYDTTFGFVRLGLAMGDTRLLRRAWRSAVHLVDLDLDAATGLLHRHGQDHRQGPPDLGHTWLAGLLLVGCLAADRRLIDNARRIATGLVTRVVNRRGLQDRLRDQGWPLLELETWLRFEDQLPIRRGADALAAGIKARWDDRNQVFRFGEGRRRAGVYEERLWLTGGVLVPALRRHVARTRDRQLQGFVKTLGRRLDRLVRNGKPGLPTHCWLRDGQILRVGRPQRSVSGFMVLEGLEPSQLARVLSRRLVRNSLLDTPKPDDPDLPTSFSIAARCDWVYR